MYIPVAPFIIVPWHQFNKGVAQCNPSLSIKDAWPTVSNEVSGHQILLSITKDSLHLSLRFSPAINMFRIVLKCLINNQWKFSNIVMLNYLIAALICSYVAGFSILTVRSTTDTSTVGIRNAMPVNLPFKAGSTFPTAWAHISIKKKKVINMIGKPC